MPALPDLPFHLLGPIVVPIIAGAIGWYGIYQPQHEQWHTAQAAYHEEQQKMSLQRDIADRHALIQAYRQRLPTTADTNWLITQTALIATQSQLQLTAVNPQPPLPDPKGYTQLIIRVECAATYHRLGQFVARLESTQPFIRVDRLELLQTHQETPAGDAKKKPSPQTDSANTPKVTLMLSTMYVPEES